MNTYNAWNGTFEQDPRFANIIAENPQRHPAFRPSFRPLLMEGMHVNDIANDERLYAQRQINQIPRNFYAEQNGCYVHFLGELPHEVIDCLAEVRNAKIDVERARTVRIPKDCNFGGDGPIVTPPPGETSDPLVENILTTVVTEAARSADELDDTQLGCPDDIAKQLGCEQFARTTAPGESER